jgi:hypothetical protein
MRTRLTAWYKKDLDEIWYGVKVLHKGHWCNLAEDGNACIYPTESEAQAKRAEMRRKRGDK